MSTATANYISTPLPDAIRSSGRLPEHARSAPSRRGGHLRLVPLRERPLGPSEGSGLTPAAGVGARGVGARVAAAGVDAHLRITRRGRLAITSTVAIALAVAGFSLLSVLGPASAASSIVVEPGATLSQIATEHLPTLPLSQAMTDIQRANSLSTTSVAAGQELVIPGR